MTYTKTPDPIADAERLGPELGQRLARILPELAEVREIRLELLDRLCEHFGRVDDCDELPGWPTESLHLLELAHDATCRSSERILATNLAEVAALADGADSEVEQLRAQVASLTRLLRGLGEAALAGVAVGVGAE